MISVPTAAFQRGFQALLGLQLNCQIKLLVWTDLSNKPRMV